MSLLPGLKLVRCARLVLPVELLEMLRHQRYKQTRRRHQKFHYNRSLLTDHMGQQLSFRLLADQD
jgi:hypothetical protein